MQIIEESSLHKYRTEIPNILFEINLTPQELLFYMQLKRIAGDKGGCWCSVPTLAKKLGVKDRYIQKYKKSLSQPRKELNGLPLIRIEKRKDKDSKNNLPDIITIVDIWEINFKYFLLVFEKTPPGAQKEQKEVDPGAHKNTTLVHTKTPKEEPIEEEPKKEEYIYREFGSHLKIKEKDYLDLCSQHTKEFIHEIIDRVNDYCAANGKKYKDYAAAIRTFIRSHKSPSPGSPKSISQADINAAYMQDLKLKNPGVFDHMRTFGKIVSNCITKMDLYLDINPEEFKTAFIKLSGAVRS